VVERGQHFGFTLKPREPIQISGHRRGQHFDCDLALQVRVGRAIHLAHATGADLRADVVDADPTARCEGQTAELYGRNGNVDKDYSS
jgi:hypothetical protein